MRIGFNLNRDARPLATVAQEVQSAAVSQVSISTEMPGPWRRAYTGSVDTLAMGFNLNRDARPLATLPPGPTKKEGT